MCDPHLVSLVGSVGKLSKSNFQLKRQAAAANIISVFAACPGCRCSTTGSTAGSNQPSNSMQRCGCRRCECCHSSASPETFWDFSSVTAAESLPAVDDKSASSIKLYRSLFCTVAHKNSERRDGQLGVRAWICWPCCWVQCQVPAAGSHRLRSMTG